MAKIEDNVKENRCCFKADAAVRGRSFLLLAVCMLVICLAKPAWAEQVDGLVTYGSFIGDNFQAPFHYRDDYFQGSATEYSDSLSTMSMCLSLSAFASKETDDYSLKYKNLYSLLEQCGFDMDSFALNRSFTEKPGMDTIGIGAASKKIVDENGDPCWLIACAIRGLGYESEWAGNFTMGAANEHEGFEDAARQVISFLRRYAGDNPQISGSVKLWITGYSRAAAVANLAAGMIDEGTHISDSFSLGTDTVYAYCFECPQGTLADLNPQNPRYLNIFSIVNQGDAVPKLAPTMPVEQFGFTHYGIVLYLPCVVSDSEEKYREDEKKMLRYYNQLGGTESYPRGQFRMKKLSITNILTGNVIGDDDDESWTQPFFLDNLITAFSAMIGNREVYVEEYQDNIRELVRILFSGDDSDTVMKVFASNIRDHAVELALKTAASVIFGQEKVTAILEDDLIDAMEKCGVKDYSREDIHNALNKISKHLIEFGANHPDCVVTLAYNLKEIASSHFPELCLAWLMSFDPNYGEGNHSDFAVGYHRMLRVSCPESLNISYMSGGDIRENPDATEFIDEDGELWLELPLDEKCSFVFSPKEDADGKIEIDEISDQFGYARILRYDELELVKGEPWTLNVEAVDKSELDRIFELVEGTSAACLLTDSSGNLHDPDIYITGSDLGLELFRIRAYPDDSGYGWTEGGGIGFMGDYEKVIAHPLEGCRFTGWYKDDELVSDEPAYRFRVTGDMTFEARFEKEESR